MWISSFLPTRFWCLLGKFLYVVLSLSMTASRISKLFWCVRNSWCLFFFFLNFSERNLIFFFGSFICWFAILFFPLTENAKRNVHVWWETHNSKTRSLNIQMKVSNFDNILSMRKIVFFFRVLSFHVFCTAFTNNENNDVRCIQKRARWPSTLISRDRQ